MEKTPDLSDRPDLTQRRPPYFLLSFCAMLAAFLLGIGAAAQGHGTLVPFKLFFPYAGMLLPLDDLEPAQVTPTFSLLAVGLAGQFPAYGLILTWAASKSRVKYGWCSVCLIHLAGMVLCMLYGK